MEVKLIRLEEVDSTNNYLRNYTPAEGEEATLCIAEFQHAGRGCGTNSWESERGKNLLFSLLIHPQEIAARDQFHISMSIALAVCDALTSFGIGDIRVKWPNDVYWRDKKICGILIENRLAGSFIRDSIIGIGLNVNQQQFLSDAPNPVSMRQILGHDVDREQVLRRIVDAFKFSPCMIDFTAMRYNAMLYRKGGGLFTFIDAEGEFQAEIMGVDNDGHLNLKRADGRLVQYAFKEVQFVI